jgi:hypothetical protein
MSEATAQMQMSTITTGKYQEVFDDVLTLDLSKCAVNVCLASVIHTEAIPRFERMKITVEMANEFRSIVKGLIERYKSEWEPGDLLFPQFALQSKPDAYEIPRLDLSAYNILLEQVQPLLSLAGMDVFEEDKQFIADIRFYVITVQPAEGDPVYFFRSYTPMKRLYRSPILAAWLHDGSYDRVAEPLFLFDQEIDCMSRSGIMFIFEQNNFQSIFRFFEEVRAVARDTLNAIKSSVPIQNFEEFAQDCEKNIIKLRKLKNIAARPYLSKITMDHIRRVIERNNLPVQVVDVDGKEMLYYDKKHRWVILKLLDDDYLWSMLTEQSYEVTGKRIL